MHQSDEFSEVHNELYNLGKELVEGDGLSRADTALAFRLLALYYRGQYVDRHSPQELDIACELTVAVLEEQSESGLPWFDVYESVRNVSEDTTYSLDICADSVEDAVKTDESPSDRVAPISAVGSDVSDALHSLSAVVEGSELEASELKHLLDFMGSTYSEPSHMEYYGYCADLVGEIIDIVDEWEDCSTVNTFHISQAFQPVIEWTELKLREEFSQTI